MLELGWWQSESFDCHKSSYTAVVSWSYFCCHRSPQIWTPRTSPSLDRSATWTGAPGSFLSRPADGTRFLTDTQNTLRPLRALAAKQPQLQLERNVVFFFKWKREAYSTINHVNSGVPQGSVFRPLLYLHTADIPVTPTAHIGASDVWLTVHRNSVWIRKTN